MLHQRIPDNGKLGILLHRTFLLPPRTTGPADPDYAFDPRRMAILLIGGDRTGAARFYDRMIPVADKLFDRH